MRVSELGFSVNGRWFVADVKPDQDGGYCASVRGHEDCFAEGNSRDELRRALTEVVELMIFDGGEDVVA